MLTSTNLESPLNLLRSFFSLQSAAQVAEYFLSPHIDPEFLRQATQDEGPSLWIVNRSDVYDSTLEALSSHSIAFIAARAREKFSSRHHSLVLISPPIIDQPLEETPDYMIEDVLGHPLVPLEAPLFFTKHPLEDYRASAALSLTRRLLEHAPNWTHHLEIKTKLSDTFAQLLVEDSSPYVRAYAARIPLFSSELLNEALTKETHELVRARLMQNPAFDVHAAWPILSRLMDHDVPTAFDTLVLSMDKRLTRDQKSQLEKYAQKRTFSPVLATLQWSPLLT